MTDRYPLNSDETQGVIEAHNILKSYFPEPEEEEDKEEDLYDYAPGEEGWVEPTEEEEEAASQAYRNLFFYSELSYDLKRCTNRELALVAQEALRRIREGQPKDDNR